MYNPIFEFDYKILENQYQMNFTSVTGHLMTTRFAGGPEIKKWELNTIKELYSTEIIKQIIEGNDKIAENLESLAK